jgi:nucleoside 2-deoxyribosyltransferase
MLKNVYLAGPIAHATYGEVTDWRNAVTRLFAYFGVQAVSPMRDKPQHLFGDLVLGTGGYDGSPLTVAPAVVSRDRNDVRSVDVVLMNLAPSIETGKVSVGSMVELGWADAQRTPVVLVMQPAGNPHEHLFVRQLCGHQTADLATACGLVLSLLNVRVPEVEQLATYLAQIAEAQAEEAA